MVADLECELVATVEMVGYLLDEARLADVLAAADMHKDD